MMWTWLLILPRFAQLNFSGFLFCVIFFLSVIVVRFLAGQRDWPIVFSFFFFFLLVFLRSSPDWCAVCCQRQHFVPVYCLESLHTIRYSRQQSVSSLLLSTTQKSLCPRNRTWMSCLSLLLLCLPSHCQPVCRMQTDWSPDPPDWLIGVCAASFSLQTLMISFSPSVFMTTCLSRIICFSLLEFFYLFLIYTDSCFLPLVGL